MLRQCERALGGTPVEFQSGSGSTEDEVRRLRRELDAVRMERDFPQEAAAYFAKEPR